MTRCLSLQSDETISPEDENDDPMEVDTTAAVIASPLPVRSGKWCSFQVRGCLCPTLFDLLSKHRRVRRVLPSNNIPKPFTALVMVMNHADCFPAPRASAATRQSESPKKATPKQSSVKKSRKSFLVRLPFHLWDAVNLDEKSEEMVLDEETENGDASIAEVSRPATTPAKPNAHATNVKTDTKADAAAETTTPEGTPDPSAANTRRGLRNRKPAQQRPYYHDAKLFEDSDSDSSEEEEEEESREASFEPANQAVMPAPVDPKMKDSPANALWDFLTAEAAALWKRREREEEANKTTEKKPDVEDDTPKTKHFKGKGRAWKKEGSDEDEEFTPKQKKAAKAAKAKADKAKAKADKAAEKAAADDTPKQKKKIGRPRKSNLSEDIVRDDSDNDASMIGSGPSPQATPSQPPKRGRGRPRKSALSSELVRDDSDDDGPAAAPVAKQAPATTPASKPAEPQSAMDLTTPPKPKTTSRPSTATSSAPTSTLTSTPKKRGRPRKSSTSTPQKSSTRGAEETEVSVSARRGSTATETVSEPKTTRARASVESAPDVPVDVPAAEAVAAIEAATAADADAAPDPSPIQDAVPTSVSPPAPISAPTGMAPIAPMFTPTPHPNRGAALVESLYPRDKPAETVASEDGAQPSVEAVESVEKTAEDEGERVIHASHGTHAVSPMREEVQRNQDQEPDMNDKQDDDSKKDDNKGAERDEDLDMDMDMDRDRQMSASMSLDSDLESEL